MIEDYLKDIRSVHIELTDKCQAACPMCARNNHGGATRPFIRNSDIFVDQFKNWFPRDFLSRLHNFYSCGNYGDPAFARDCLEIYSYVRDCNSDTRLALHTNGSLRKPDWWVELARQRVEVIFAVDGFAGKHELYRRNTKFEKVIESITAFVNAGGDARVDSLVFAHNENETDELEKFLLNLGVKEVNFKSTKRFYDLEKFPVQDVQGNHEYDLFPAKGQQWQNNFKGQLEKFLDKDFVEQASAQATVNAKCVSKKEVYVDPYGNVLPCCWIGSDWVEHEIKGNHILQQLRNITVENSKTVFADVGVPNLNDRNILEILSDGTTWNKLDTYWKGKNKCLTCVKNCSAELYEQ